LFALQNALKYDVADAPDCGLKGACATMDFSALSWSEEELFAYRALCGPFGIPLPPAPLREATGTTTIGDFLSIGETWAQNCYPYLPSSPHVLDIGCGCGKMARFLVAHPTLQYIGLDILHPAITWAREAFRHYANRFQFEHVDIWSSLYNPRGSLDPLTFRFPLNDASVNFVICGSLFTHLLENELRHYLSEIGRCLESGGKLIASIHIEPKDSLDFSGEASRIDMTKDFWIQCCKVYGLSVHRDLGNLYGQQVYIMQASAA
jgi:SAM-dependent methyltransferase